MGDSDTNSARLRERIVPFIIILIAGLTTLFNIILLFSLPSSFITEAFTNNSVSFNTTFPNLDLNLNGSLLVFLHVKDIVLNGNGNSMDISMAFMDPNGTVYDMAVLCTNYGHPNPLSATQILNNQSLIVGYFTLAKANVIGFHSAHQLEIYTYRFQFDFNNPYLVYYMLYPYPNFGTNIPLSEYLNTLKLYTYQGYIKHIYVYLTDGNNYWLIYNGSIRYHNTSTSFLIFPSNINNKNTFSLNIYPSNNLSNVKFTFDSTQFTYPVWIKINFIHQTIGPYEEVVGDLYMVKNISVDLLVSGNKNISSFSFLKASLGITRLGLYSYFQIMLMFVIPLTLVTFVLLREFFEVYRIVTEKIKSYSSGSNSISNVHEAVSHYLRNDIYVLIVSTSIILSSQGIALRDYPYVDNYSLYLTFVFVVSNVVMFIFFISEALSLNSPQRILRFLPSKMIIRVVETILIILIIIPLFIYSYYMWSKLVIVYNSYDVNYVLFPPPLGSLNSFDLTVPPIINLSITSSPLIPVSLAIASLVFFPYIFTFSLGIVLIIMYGFFKRSN